MTQKFLIDFTAYQLNNNKERSPRNNEMAIWSFTFDDGSDFMQFEKPIKYSIALNMAKSYAFHKGFNKIAVDAYLI